MGYVLEWITRFLVMLIALVLLHKEVIPSFLSQSLEGYVAPKDLGTTKTSWDVLRFFSDGESNRAFASCTSMKQNMI